MLAEGVAMPELLQIIWALMAPLIVLAVAWLIRSVISYRTELEIVKKDIAAINERCMSRMQDTSRYREGSSRMLNNLGAGVSRIDRNMIRIAGKLGIPSAELEQHGD